MHHLWIWSLCVSCICMCEDYSHSSVFSNVCCRIIVLLIRFWRLLTGYSGNFGQWEAQHLTDKERTEDESGRMGTLHKARNRWSQMGSEPPRLVHVEQGVWAPLSLHRPKSFVKCMSLFAFGKTTKELSTAKSHTWAHNDPFSPILYVWQQLILLAGEKKL